MQRFKYSFILVLTCTCVAFYVFVFNKLSGQWLDKYSLVLFMIIAIYAIGAQSRVLSNKFTKAISTISFEMYLSHMLVFRAVQTTGLLYILGKGISGYVFAFICVTVICSILVILYKRLEKIVAKYLVARLNKKFDRN